MRYRINWEPIDPSLGNPGKGKAERTIMIPITTVDDKVRRLMRLVRARRRIGRKMVSLGLRKGHSGAKVCAGYRRV